MYPVAMNHDHSLLISLIQNFSEEFTGTSAVKSDIPYGQRIDLSAGRDKVIINLYHTGKVLIQGKDSPLKQCLAEAIAHGNTASPGTTFPSVRENPAVNPALTAAMGLARIGIDESGKGDFFGPLVISAARIGPEDEAWLRESGLKDSKQLTEGAIKRLAATLRKAIPSETVVIPPPRYNELMTKMGNLNKLLAWGHGRALESLLEQTTAELVIADKFANLAVLEGARMEQGRKLRYLAVPRAEADLAVAAASVLARAAFLGAMKRLSETAGFNLPRGCSAAVDNAGRRLVQTLGQEALSTFAKIHFKTTEKILN